LIPEDEVNYCIQFQRLNGIKEYTILIYIYSCPEHSNTNEYTRKKGFKKLEFCATQAASHEIEYFWIDTACINKFHASELSRAIMCMFKWYQGAARCYVYLSDVSVYMQDGITEHIAWKSDFRNSRWFTRGWTLQELLAARVAQFYEQNDNCLGDKVSLEEDLCKITNIPSTRASHGRT
jgi:hypothetical protein